MHGACAMPYIQDLPGLDQDAALEVIDALALLLAVKFDHRPFGNKKFRNIIAC
jgi:hypothetical protein